jgi:hypothetical protein
MAAKFEDALSVRSLWLGALYACCPSAVHCLPRYKSKAFAITNLCKSVFNCLFQKDVSRSTTNRFNTKSPQQREEEERRRKESQKGDASGVQVLLYLCIHERSSGRFTMVCARSFLNGLLGASAAGMEGTLLISRSGLCCYVPKGFDFASSTSFLQVLLPPDVPSNRMSVHVHALGLPSIIPATGKCRYWPNSSLNTAQVKPHQSVALTI